MLRFRLLLKELGSRSIGRAFTMVGCGRDD